MEHRHTNRLANETSPYLLQHAHNPVDWYAWGPEAFEASRSQNKPIFLSVGYSTCYWCHVMERQSFENEAIAAEMNKLFINIKVDREERPDVDQLYMMAVQILTRQGGWPMSVFLTPDLRPFYGGTYFPPTDMHGRPGFPTVLRAIEDAYRNRASDVEKSASQLVNILKQVAHPLPPENVIEIDNRFIKHILDRSTTDYDPDHGGFGGAPKFPRETLLELLLVANSSEISNHESQIKHTLNAMANGGIRDHLGGGFHRYSTDAEWLVPHFEIMLYDNAMLAWVYAEAHRQTQEMRYRFLARDIISFVQRNMRSKGGAFYTAIDAEAEAQEGSTYLWTPEQIEEILGPEDAKTFNEVYGLDRGFNFADPHHSSGMPDRNVLYLPDGPPSDQLEYSKLSDLRRTLLSARTKRPQPILDTKIITSWNALMIRMLAHAGKICEDEGYIELAATAADFLLRHHRRPDGTLIRTSRDGTSGPDGTLEDYAFLAQALLALHETGNTAHLWLDHARSIVETMKTRFGDSAGGFFFTDSSTSDIIVRQKTATDSPLPSGNGVAAMVLLELDQPDEARKILETFAPQMQQQGEGMSSMIQAALLYIQKHGPLTVQPGASGAPSDRPLAPQQVAANIVSINPVWKSPTQLDLHISILNGFHIQAYDADKGFISTQIMVEGATRIDYPKASAEQFEFTDQPLRVLSGQIIASAHFASPRKSGTTLRAGIHYQACDQSACLPPVTKQIEIAVPSHPDHG